MEQYLKFKEWESLGIKRPKSVNDITGRKFNKLTVIKLFGLSNEKKPSLIWLCKCDCGNLKKVTGNNLRRNQIGSCGCLRQHEKGIAAFNATLLAYKKSAEKRKIEFSLSSEEFKKLTSSNCYYCGEPPNNIVNRGRFIGDYPSNGIDRVDSKLGYTIGNSVSCCKICNVAKMANSKEIFLKMVKNIYENLHLENPENIK